ncbi:M14 family metallopeptidase [Lutibacter sp.]|uniref:M14 family metallopeptidase n=1 Tax=Lutibacter sp. TaxID=1925666 RepID=UPI003569A1E3
MKKNLLSTLLFTILAFYTLNAQELKSPSEFLGYELGTRFTRHHAVVDYFTYVSENLKSVKLEKYGQTNEFRPLYLSYISSEENINNLETIREDNLKRAGIIKGDSKLEIATVWLSYNVHGNEASSTEAAMQTLYELVTNKQDWLKNTLVIIDPCLNPDGRDRYANWYNQIKSTPYNTDPYAVEHREPWPRARANHYLFDLNRDWAWATQIETQQRLKMYNKWLPQVHVDFHEQSYENPYYFAPGAEPFHEIITDWQRDFQTQIGKNHAKYFDQQGWRYFTKESFDLLYPSYGDTYPTYMGAIGMTYEQAGISAGLGVKIENNTVLTLKDRIAHHFTTGISTVEMTAKNSSKLLSEFKKFFNNSSAEYQSYVLRGDAEKINQVVSLLKTHEIYNYSPEEKTIKASDYDSNSLKTIRTTNQDLVIPTNQPKGKMVKALFEKEAKLTDSLTYDITAWSIPYAYGLQGFASKTSINVNSNATTSKFVANQPTNNAYAYIHKWNEVSDATFLGDLLENGYNVRYSKTDFSVEGNSYKKGTLVIMRADNEHIKYFDDTITKLANSLNTKLSSVNTGFVSSGTDFGSSNYTLIKPKRVAAIAGEGTSSLSFGEIWHFFETQLQYPLTVLNTSNLKSTNLSNYDVLILPDDYIIDTKELEMFTLYVTKGGTIISLGTSVNSFADKDGFNLKTKKDTLNTNSKPNLVPYDQQERTYVKTLITGSIFKSTIENTHPLAFGYPNYYHSLKLSGTSYKLLDKGFNVGYFAENSKNISGFAGVDALKQVPNSLLFGIENKGRGQLIYMVDNPLFRSFWQNGKLFFTNAVFLN